MEAKYSAQFLLFLATVKLILVVITSFFTSSMEAYVVTPGFDITFLLLQAHGLAHQRIIMISGKFSRSVRFDVLAATGKQTK